MIKQFSLFIMLFIPTISCYSQNIKNYLQTKDAIKFQNKTYLLKWSSHPTENYYKQEYLTKEEKIENYASMMILEFLKGDFTAKQLVSHKIEELKKIKKNNPIVNYNVLEKDGEIILDFLVSSNSNDEKTISIIERNVYRYKTIKDNDIKGILLFGISERGYKDNVEEFFKNLKKNKNALIISVGNMNLPKIKPME